jgi:hypothetical protein
MMASAESSMTESSKRACLRQPRSRMLGERKKENTKKKKKKDEGERLKGRTSVLRSDLSQLATTVVSDARRCGGSSHPSQTQQPLATRNRNMARVVIHSLRPTIGESVARWWRIRKYATRTRIPVREPKSKWDKPIGPFALRRHGCNSLESRSNRSACKPRASGLKRVLLQGRLVGIEPLEGEWTMGGLSCNGWMFPKRTPTSQSHY